MVEPLVRAHVRVLEVDGHEARIVPRQPVPRAVRVEQGVLGGPVQPVGQAGRVRGEVGEHLVPQGEHLRGVLVQALGGELALQLRAGVQVRALQRHPRELTAVPQGHGGAQGGVVADGLQRGHGVHELEVRDAVVLHQVQHQGRGPELQQRGRVGEVGVPDDHVQPAVAGVVRVGLVPGVDHGAVDRGLQAHRALEEVRALAQLEARAGAVHAEAHAPGAAEHLAGREERQQRRRDALEGHGAVHRVVLVRAVGHGLVVGVVLVEVHGR